MVLGSRGPKKAPSTGKKALNSPKSSKRDTDSVQNGASNEGAVGQDHTLFVLYRFDYAQIISQTVCRTKKWMNGKFLKLFTSREKAVEFVPSMFEDWESRHNPALASSQALRDANPLPTGKRRQYPDVDERWNEGFTNGVLLKVGKSIVVIKEVHYRGPLFSKLWLGTVMLGTPSSMVGVGFSSSWINRSERTKFIDPFMKAVAFGSFKEASDSAWDLIRAKYDDHFLGAKTLRKHGAPEDDNRRSYDPEGEFWLSRRGTDVFKNFAGGFLVYEEPFMRVGKRKVDLMLCEVVF